MMRMVSSRNIVSVLVLSYSLWFSRISVELVSRVMVVVMLNS